MKRDINGNDLAQLAARIDAAPTVERRTAGLYGALATSLAGERIDGIRLEDSGKVSVRVVIRPDADAQALRADVCSALSDHWAEAEVFLWIDDVPPAD